MSTRLNRGWTLMDPSSPHEPTGVLDEWELLIEAQRIVELLGQPHGRAASGQFRPFPGQVGLVVVPGVGCNLRERPWFAAQEKFACVLEPHDAHEHLR